MQSEEIKAGEHHAATPLERIADCADLLARAIRALVAATPEIPAQVKAEILKGRE